MPRKKKEQTPLTDILSPSDLPTSSLDALKECVIGQDESLEKVIPYIQAYNAGLATQGRPVGVVLLLGPTGVGKTHSVEAVAGAVHGDPSKVLRIDCGEFSEHQQMLKLIGAPPSYLGHRETKPMLSQDKLTEITSTRSDLSIILFDEIEKAHESIRQFLLGVLDKGVASLGDNTSVNFQNSMIFMTSNLGAKEIKNKLKPEFGYEAVVGYTSPKINTDIKRAGVAAVKRKFSPEFFNRIDEVIVYRSLDREAMRQILYLQVKAYRKMIVTRLGLSSFHLEYTLPAQEKLLDLGTSTEYGARELRRVLQRNFYQPLAAQVVNARVPPGSTVVLDVRDNEFILRKAA